jgi:hypothetical protein
VLKTEEEVSRDIPIRLCGIDIEKKRGASRARHALYIMSSVNWREQEFRGKSQETKVSREGFVRREK